MAARGRLQPTEHVNNIKRSLFEINNCEAIRNCEQCFTTKDESVTMLVCRRCASGYQTTNDLTACGKAHHPSSALPTIATVYHTYNAGIAECAPGYFASGSGDCTICPFGSYCLGESEPARACATQGLTTLTRGSRGAASCGKVSEGHSCQDTGSSQLPSDPLARPLAHVCLLSCRISAVNAYLAHVMLTMDVPAPLSMHVV